MKLKSLEYATPGWSLDGLNFSETSLIVGRNAVGKSKTIETLNSLVSVILQTKEIAEHDNFFYKIIFSDNDTELTYSFACVQGNITLERLIDHNENILIQRDEKSTTFFKDEINPPSNKLTINVRRDTKLYPQIEKIVNRIIDQKLELKKNYIFTNIPKNKVLVNRLRRVIAKSMKYIVDSIRYSDFNVLGHEVEFGMGKEYEPIQVKLDNGKLIEIVGKIDRVDIMNNEKEQYIRIIDYKSSIKDIDLNEVKAGIKLQLLTYMNEMCKQESAEPAGAFYYNLIEPMVKASQNMSDEQIEEELRKQFKMRGLILADVDIIRKMDKNLDTGSSNIIPATINKDETLSKKASNISKQQFEYLQKYTNKIIKQISEEILSGNINIKPYYNTKNKKTPCEYCTYKSICQFENGICKKEYNYISNLEKEAILEMMKEK